MSDIAIAPGQTKAGELYLDLLAKCLTRTVAGERYRAIHSTRQPQKTLAALLQGFLRPLGFEVVRREAFNYDLRRRGIDMPPEAETMVGLIRLENIRECLEDIVRHGVAGDVIETGVWRGGACIYMRAVLDLLEQGHRTVWLADSFAGLPRPDGERFAADRDTGLSEGQFAAMEEEVERNFEKYGMRHNIRILRGWFRDTLPKAPLGRLALMRLDGDLYESTMDALEPLYPKLERGGWAIIDDWFLPSCRAAVNDYRRRHNITEPILRTADDMGAYWRKEA